MHLLHCQLSYSYSSSASAILDYPVSVTNNTCANVTLDSQRLPSNFNVNFKHDGSDSDVDVTCEVRVISPQEGRGEILILIDQFISGMAL